MFIWLPYLSWVNDSKGWAGDPWTSLRTFRIHMQSKLAEKYKTRPCTSQSPLIEVPDSVSSGSSTGVCVIKPASLKDSDFNRLELFPAHPTLPLINGSISIMNEFFKSSITGLCTYSRSTFPGDFV